MLKKINVNTLKWIIPYELEEKYANDETALQLVNSEERKLTVNGFVLISANESDLQYIKSLFSSVRIKIGHVNSIKFYGIEYATNYNDMMFRCKNDNLKKQFEKRFIRFEDILTGAKTVEDLKEATSFIKSYYEKRSLRSSQKRYTDNLREIKKRAKIKMREKVLSSLPNFKDKYNNDVYLKDGVIYTRYQILSTHKCLL